MTVAHDAATESIRASSGGDPYAFDHTPVGTPRGVVAVAIQNTSPDSVVGVTYGGVAMTRVTNGFQVDTSGEDLAAYLYFLGASIPTGTQSVSWNLSANLATPMDFFVATITAAGDTEVVDSDGLSESRADPSVTLSYGGRTCISYCATGSGRNSVGDIAEASGQTRLHDAALSGSTKCTVFSRQTTPGSTDFAPGYTVVLDDIAFVAVAISEIVVGPTIVPGKSQAIIVV